jgi:hypothetical protein
MDSADTVHKAASMTREAVDGARDAACQAAQPGRKAAGAGSGSVREYVSDGLNHAVEMRDSITDFVQRQPWVALVGAFVVGYIAARALRRLSV